MPSRRRARKWTWLISILALIVFLDLCALTWYFWAMPEQHFENWKKMVSTFGSWLGSILVFFGIRHKFKKEQSIEQVLSIRPVQLCIIAFTIVNWYFVLPFHSVTISVHEEGSGKPLPGVAVTLDDNYKTQTDEKGEIKITGLRAISHELQLKKEGYEAPDKTTLSFMNVISFQGGPIKVLLKRLEGTVKLETIPPGATIYLNGDEHIPHGPTPQTLSLPVGKRQVKFKRKDYEDTSWEEISIDVGENRLPPKTLQRLKGTVTLKTIPASARIYLDGNENEAIGETTKTVSLPTGKHQIKFKKDGYYPTSWEEIAIDVGENPPIERTLKKIPPPQKYSLTVYSEPQDGEIYVDGVLKGRTPDTIKLTTGEHTIEIRKNGYKSKKDVVSIPDQSIATFDLEKEIR